MSDKKITETKVIVNSKHKLKVGDTILVEEKQQITTTDDQSKEAIVELFHKRTIDGKSYMVKEIKEGGKEVEQNIVSDFVSEDEFQLFKANWQKLWLPAVTETGQIRPAELTED